MANIADGPDGASSISAPAGWTQEQTAGYGNGALNAWQFTKVAGASEPANYTFTSAEIADIVASISAYSGCDTTTPVNVKGQQTNTSSTSVTAPSITTTVANTMLVGHFSTEFDTSFTPPSGMTERSDQVSGGGLADFTSEAADEAFAAAAATGTRVATAVDAEQNIGQLLALAPATTGAADRIPLLTLQGAG